MAVKMSTRGLDAALLAEGFALPPNCREVRLIASPNSALMLQYDTYVTDEDLAKVGRALIRMGEEAK